MEDQSIFYAKNNYTQQPTSVAALMVQIFVITLFKDNASVSCVGQQSTRDTSAILVTFKAF